MAAAVLNCSLRSRRSRWKPPSSSHLVKRHMPRSSLPTPDAFHHLLLQIGGARSAVLNCSLPSNCSLRSRDARWKPPSSSHLVKRHMPRSSLPTRDAFHNLRLQIDGARSVLDPIGLR